MSEQPIAQETNEEVSQEEKRLDEELLAEEKLRKQQEALVQEAFSGVARPPQEQIDAWKAQYGAVFVSALSRDEVFIWKQLTRAEWLQVQMTAQAKQQTAKTPEEQQQMALTQQYEMEEAICDICVLWKSRPANWSQGPAGSPSTLHEQIMMNSNFMPTQLAHMSVIRL
jgi:hypothetical protein